jgi:quinol monooxygenase YgiN
MAKCIVQYHLNVDPETWFAGSKSRLPDTRRFPGCISITYYQDADDPQRILSIQEWASREDQAKYVAWRAERGDSAVILSLVREQPSVRWIDEVDI